MWRPTKENMCKFESYPNYYLAGFNRYTFKNVSMEDCQKQCCNLLSCLSIDFAHRNGQMSDQEGGQCWLSEAAEGVNGGGGLTYTTKGETYWQVVKRGSRLMTIEQHQGVRSFEFVEGNNKSMFLVKRPQDTVITALQVGPTWCTTLYVSEYGTIQIQCTSMLHQPNFTFDKPPLNHT